MSPTFSSLNLIFLGPPGSGKETQAEALARSYEIAHISSRALLRDEIRKDSFPGRQVRPSVELGEPVDDHVMAGLILRRLNQEDCARGFLLTGYPRNTDQASSLDGILAELGRVIERVIYLEVPEEEIASRLTKASGDPLDTAPTEAGLMAPKVIQARIASYRQSVGPLVDLYRARGKLLVVDGNCPQEIVTDRVQQAIGMPVSV